jgi:hypothetical protein
MFEKDFETMKKINESNPSLAIHTLMKEIIEYCETEKDLYDFMLENPNKTLCGVAQIVSKGESKELLIQDLKDLSKSYRSFFLKKLSII